MRIFVAILFALVQLMFADPVTAKHTSTEPLQSGAKQENKTKAGLFPKLLPLIPHLAPVEERARLVSRVSHSESFPPLPEELRPGSDWNEDKVADPQAKKENIWYKVPKWLAGEYSYGTMLHYYKKNLQTGVEQQLDEVRPPLSAGRHRGILVDKQGGIWQKAYGGGISDPSNPDHGNIVYEKFDDELVGYVISPEQYVENSAGVEFYIDKETNKIIEVLRWQRIREFQLKNGKVLVNVSEQKFDLDGKPLLLFKSKGEMIKRSSFESLAPGGESRVAGTYGNAVRELRAFLEQMGELALAPDAVEDSGSMRSVEPTQK